MNTDYSPRTDVDWNEIKKESLKYFTGNYDDDRPLTEKDVVEELTPLWNALKSVDFNLNLFFSKKLYLGIPDDGLTDYIMAVGLMAVKPMSDYVVDWMNGYLDFDCINPDIAAGAEWHPANKTEILEYLWYCRSDEDIWWMLGQGIGNIKNLYEWYMGRVQTPDVSGGHYPPCYFIKNEKKALKMILFLELILAESNNAVALTTRILYNNADARKTIWQMLLPELLIEDAWKDLADKFHLSAAQIYNVVLRFNKTMDELPAGWGMDLFSKMSVLDDFCYVECHPETKR